MADFVQIICAVLIVAAAVFYIYRSVKRPAGESRLQMVLAVFQVLLCGWFFALCISDVLDIQVNFSLMRLILYICYALAFLAITIYTLFLRAIVDIASQLSPCSGSAFTGKRSV